ncbi:MAG: nucleotidyltransferase domain-containing protein [Ignavibacteriae bacterium]|nr:MAG: nucleotidyltransferase domain-containing protein [Ignavibacteriota bacterium]
MSEREKQILNNSASVIKEYLNHARILLFVSRAKGTSGKNSDFDFAVDSRKPDLKTLEKFYEKLDDIAGLYSIDLVFLNDVDTGFRNIILKNCKILYERNN